MFVDKPLPAPRREELKRKADEVRDEILRKADKDLLNVLKDRGIESFKGGEIEQDEDLGDDWVRFRPKWLKSSCRRSCKPFDNSS